MHSELITFLIILVTCFLIFWLVSFRKIKNIKVSLLFEPATYNLGIFTITGLIGIITVYYLGQDISFNKIVHKYNSDDINFKILILALLIFVMLTIVARTNRKNITNKTTKIPKNVVIILMTLIITLIIINYLRLSNLILAGSANDQYEIMLYRKAISGNWIYYFFNRLVVEGVGWVIYLHILVNVNSKKLNSLTILILLLGILYGLYYFSSLKKIGLVYFTLCIYGAIKYHKNISVINLFYLMFALLVLIVLAYAFLIRNIELEYMISPFKEGFIGRVFISEISSLYPHFQLYGNYFDHIGIYSLSNTLSQLLDENFSARSGTVIMNYVNPHWENLGIGGTFNTIFIGEAYANYGWTGVFFSILWVPFFYYIVVLYIVKYCDNYSESLLIFTALNISPMSGLNDFIYNPFLILILLTYTNYTKLRKILFK